MLDSLNKAIYAAENASQLTRAAYQLTLADELMTPAYMDSSETSKVLRVYELLRTHDTAGTLLRILIDELDRLTAALDELQSTESKRRTATATEKTAGGAEQC